MSRKAILMLVFVLLAGLSVPVHAEEAPAVAPTPAQAGCGLSFDLAPAPDDVRERFLDRFTWRSKTDQQRSLGSWCYDIQCNAALDHANIHGRLAEKIVLWKLSVSYVIENIEQSFYR